MKRYFIFIIACLILGLSPRIGSFFSNSTSYVQAQSTSDYLKNRIKTVVASADGKISQATKIRLLELISNKIKASPNVVITDIYIFFLREVKKMRTTDEIIALSDINKSSAIPNSNPISATNGNPDFSISFASIPRSINVDDSYAPIRLKIKNIGSSYTPDGLGSLKFGCKGIDGNIYPYRSYVDNQIIGNNSELSIEVPNVFIGHLTASKGFKLLSCKIDSSNLINELNEDDNDVNVSLQIY